jgi:hypothetical protein
MLDQLTSSKKKKKNKYETIYLQPVIFNDPLSRLYPIPKYLRDERPLRDDKMLLLKLLSLKPRISRLLNLSDSSSPAESLHVFMQ